MNRTHTQLKGLNATLTAHQDAEDRLLMVELVADAAPEGTPENDPLQLAMVIDRSGSMSGAKLQIAKQAVARMVRSLRPTDRVGLVVFDSDVDLLSRMSAPTESLAKAIEQIHAGSCTNLYGGWVAAAKMVGHGGRVILLSDGMANVGRHTKAPELSAHAALSYKKYGVTTSTVGVGSDYDEAIMAGMAREGGGGHYFAHKADDILEAFSQERFSMGSIAFSQISFRYAGTTLQLGHLWAGESKTAVLPVKDLSAGSASLRFTRRDTGETQTVDLAMPTEFGDFPEATFELLLAQASELAYDALGVVDKHTAAHAEKQIRAFIFERLLKHPHCHTEAGQAVLDRLCAAADRLAALVENFDAHEASMHRKQAMQMEYNLRERGKAYSADDADAQMVQSLSASRGTHSGQVQRYADPIAYALASGAQWRAWGVAPVSFKHKRLEVGLSNPRNGFVLTEIQMSLKVHVAPVFMSAEDVARELDRAEREFGQK